MGSEMCIRDRTVNSAVNSAVDSGSEAIKNGLNNVFGTGNSQSGDSGVYRNKTKEFEEKRRREREQEQERQRIEKEKAKEKMLTPGSYTDLRAYSASTRKISPHLRSPSPSGSGHTSSVPDFPASYLRPSPPPGSVKYTDNYSKDYLSAHSGSDPVPPEVPVRTSVTDWQIKFLSLIHI